MMQGVNLVIVCKVLLQVVLSNAGVNLADNRRVSASDVCCPCTQLTGLSASWLSEWHISVGELLHIQDTWARAPAFIQIQIKVFFIYCMNIYLYVLMNSFCLFFWSRSETTAYYFSALNRTWSLTDLQMCARLIQIFQYFFALCNNVYWLYLFSFA